MLTNFGTATQDGGQRRPAPPTLLTAAYVSLVCFGLPLVLHNGFFDVVETKFSFFTVLSAAYLVLLVAARLLFPQKGAQKPLERRARFSLADGCMLLFAACSLIACALNLKSAPGGLPGVVVGTFNRYQGVLTVLLYCALFFAVSRGFRPGPLPCCCAAAAFAAVCILAVLNDCSVDPLRLYRNLSALDERRYVSTLGNGNFYASYLGILLPAVLGFFCLTKQRLAAWVAGALLVLGGLAIAPSGSDGLGLALVAAFAAAPFLCCSSKCAAGRYLLSLLLLLAGMQGSRLLRMAIRPRFYAPFFFRAVTNPVVTGVLAAAALLLLLLLKKLPEGRLRRVRTPYAVFLSAAVVGGILLLTLANTVFSDVSFGVLDRFLKLNDAWGTDRGKVFAHCLTAFRTFSPAQKLIGGGPGCLYAYDVANRIFQDAVLDAAHCEYLQYLLTTGLVGLAAYLGLLLSALVAGVKALQQNRSPLLFGLLLGIFAYAAEALVGIAQPVSTPFLFLFLALTRSFTQRT